MPKDGIIEIDLHGKNVYQARIAIDAALRRSRGVYMIRLIHGFNSGQTLKEMINSEYSTHSSVTKLQRGENDGITELLLRKL